MTDLPEPPRTRAQVERTLRRCAKRLAPVEDIYTERDAAILAGHQLRIPQASMAEWSDVTPMAISKVVSRARREGLVE